MKSSHLLRKKALVERYMLKEGSCPKTPLPYKSYILQDTKKEVVSMMCLILGYDDDSTLDSTILGFMEVICLGQGSPTLFNYAQYLSDNIHFQLHNFHSTRIFGYQSYFVYLLSFARYNKFKHIPLRRNDEQGKPFPVTEWTTTVRKHAKNEGLS